MNTLRVSPSAYIDALTLPELHVELVLAASRLVGTRIVPSSLGKGFVICRECGARTRQGSPLLHTEACIAGWAAHVLLALGHAEAEQVLSNCTGKESSEQENRSSEPARTAAEEKRPFLLPVLAEASSVEGYGASEPCTTLACSEKRHNDCPDVDGNCCDCNCHLSLPALPSQYHEPWTLSADDEVLDAEGHVMVDPQGCSLPEVGAQLVMRRIVACVNHCQGALTHELCRETERAAAGGGM